MNTNIEYAWYKLINVKGLGAKSLLTIYHALAKNVVTVEEIFQLDKTHFYTIFSNFGKGKFARLKYENFHALDENKLHTTFEGLQNKNIKIIPVQDETYPKLIKKRLKVNSPPLLYCKGHLPLLNTKSISIVGSRSADEYTLLLTKNIAVSLAKEGYNIVSGYAKGVDTTAHLGALSVEGTTSVVLPLGIQNLSIKRDFRGFDWEANTLFVSQFLPHERWQARNAMARNKIVAALSNALIVITSGPERDEKGRRSGTFDAGKSALEMNMPVFVLSPTLFTTPPKGNQALIHLGGIEIKNGKELLDNLARLEVSKKETSSSPSKQQLSLEVG